MRMFKNGKLSGKLLVGGIIIVLAGLSIACYSLWNDKKYANGYETEPIKQNIYSSFVESWNDNTKKYSSAFQFLGANATSPQLTLDTLFKWCLPFCQKPTPQYEEELKILGEEVPPTSFHAYEEFRQNHYRNSPPEFSLNMDSKQLSQTLNNYIGLKINGKTPDYITPETVKIIIYMNSFCQFFENEKDRLHAQKIDTIITSCERLHTNGKYSELDKLLD